MILDYLFMSLSHLAISRLLLYVLILWICIFRFRDLERSGSIHWGPRVFQWAGRPALVPPVPYFSFWLTGFFSLKWAFVYILVHILLDLVVKQNTCKVYQFVTCITLYLSFIVGIYEYTTLVLYSDFVLYCTFTLSVYTWGQFWPTYIRRGDVSVSARIGALQVGIRA